MFKTKSSIALVFFLSLIFPSFVFGIDDIDNAGIIKSARNSAINVTACFNDGGKFVGKGGTGFVIDTKKSPGLLVVTNRHILERETKDKKIITPCKILLKVNLSDIDYTFWEASIIGMHDLYDIALLNFEKPANLPKDVTTKSADGKNYYAFQNSAFILEDTVLADSEIKEGLEVFYSGYPLSLGTDQIKNYPITRKGIIAQVIPNDETFVIDGFASHGNSGSPIYCLSGGAIKLLGIQFAVYTDKEFSDTNSGLTRAIKASVIKEYLYRLIDEGKYKGQWSK